MKLNFKLIESLVHLYVMLILYIYHNFPYPYYDLALPGSL